MRKTLAFAALASVALLAVFRGGNCTVQSKGKKYDCFHFNIEPKKTAGLVRCTTATP